jgi:hypothetical protein
VGLEDAAELVLVVHGGNASSDLDNCFTGFHGCKQFREQLGGGF